MIETNQNQKIKAKTRKLKTSIIIPLRIFLTFSLTILILINLSKINLMLNKLIFLINNNPINNNRMMHWKWDKKIFWIVIHKKRMTMNRNKMMIKKKNKMMNNKMMIIMNLIIILLMTKTAIQKIQLVKTSIKKVNSLLYKRTTWIFWKSWTNKMMIQCKIEFLVLITKGLSIIIWLIKINNTINSLINKTVINNIIIWIISLEHS